MPLKTDAYYRAVADEAVRQAGMTEPPIDIGAIASRLGSPIVLVQLPTFFRAAAIDRDGILILVVNASLDETSRRRHTAHLLGHVLAALDDRQDGFPRDAGPDHHVADVVGAELLLPSRMVEEQAAKWFNDYRYLARLFCVSEGEMLARMGELGLVHSRGLAWDY